LGTIKIILDLIENDKAFLTHRFLMNIELNDSIKYLKIYDKVSPLLME